MTDRSRSDRPAVTDGFGGVVNGSTFIRRTLVWGIGLAVAATAMYLMQTSCATCSRPEPASEPFGLAGSA